MKNFTIKVVVSEVKPFLYVVKSKIFIDIKEFQAILDLFPKEAQLDIVSYNKFEVGTINRTGHYNGLIGFIQRKEADVALYPVPLDIMSPPGTFSHPLFEGGTQILSVAWSTKKKQTDLIDGLLNFDLPSTICILFFFFFISLVVHRLFLKKDQKFYDSLFLMYRILFKEHNIRLKNTKSRLIFSALLIYHLMLAFIVETQVNTQLVVAPAVHYIDTIDQLWADKRRKPNFIKNHISNENFKNARGNKKALDIYERAKKCGDCIRDTDSLLLTVHQDVEKEMDHNWVLCSEQQMITATKKIMCNKDHKLIMKMGVMHTSPFIFKNLQAILFRYGMDEDLKNYIIHNMLWAVEAGVPNRFLAQIKDSGYGYIHNTDIEYKTCYQIDFIQAIEASDNLSYRVRVKNVVVLISVQLILSGVILFLFSAHWLFSMVKAAYKCL